MDQQHDLLSSSPNSHTAHYNSGDTMATSISGMTINDHHHGNQFHKENGIAVGLVRPGDCPMKVRGLYFPSLQPSLVHTFSPFALPVMPHTRRKHYSEHLPPINGRYCNGTAETGGTAPTAQSKTNGDAEKRAPSSIRPHAAGTKIPAMTSADKNGKDSPKTPETSGHSSPGTPKSPASKAADGKPPITGNEIKKVAVIRSTPKSPKNRSPTSLSAAAPLPDLKNIRSKVGSTDNLRHQPGGGRVQILDQKVDFSNIQAKCGSKGNLRHVPGGGNVKILDQKVDFSNVQSKCGSKDNLKHVPGGGSVQIPDQKLDLSSVQSRCGSKDNIKHLPGGGKVQILHKKIDLTNVQSKCGSKDNIRHKPGGGNIEIRSEKVEFKAQSKVGSMENIKHTPGGGSRRREKGRGADTPRDEGFVTPDPSDTPTLSSASMSPEPILLSNPQIKIEDSN
ncbi:microtubule-associated protein tau-like isoform X3 [Sinocyclocheilus anshuiensis]|uniref:microtubule-associated protein tau-like isoform X3 n=1 Tax=Sinocyclocheilus anshuiensis TaxID=1608454 RepID=UPI0007B9908E|nr:PREDICTED: microtubule-associated protein tau-like isoform X3 [Sinocyclocheilus anshuiensis]